MQTYHIHINGIVQGVGFRPLVYLLASDMRLNGYVINGSDGLHIFFNSPEETASLFLKKIKQNAPARSKVISAILREAPDVSFTGFKILVEDDAKNKQVLLSPDAALCQHCRNELHDVNNRRYRYPFITCTQCGPRYSIVADLPYERHHTSMQPFTMCSSCRAEYDQVADRRFFSQTNSCSDCGIKLSLFESAASLLSNDSETVLSQIKSQLSKGKIIAVKGIGGYLLLCDANNAQTIQLLRSRKNRPTKPLALLYPDMEKVAACFELKKEEKDLLESNEAPIVLLYTKAEALSSLAIKDIAPGLRRLGVMIPGNPLLDLIAHDFGKPLIATSANISGSPIIYKDEDALTYLFDIADHIVSYDRDILVPQDDSVVQVSKYAGQTIILRRSRGYAPAFLAYEPQTNDCLLATGAFLKSSFTLSAGGNIFISQFLGSGESYESQQMYRGTLAHLLKTYDAVPHTIMADLHPQYSSHQYALELAEKYDADVKLIQHHEAHFAAVLAENGLLHAPEPILGVIWDGTGLGHDGNIWGGEFFTYADNEMARFHHFDYIPAIAGDKMALQPRISALCACSDMERGPGFLKDKFTDAEWNTYRSLVESTSLFTSSVGRIFDAVASLLGACDKQTYEGEAAMYLQALAEVYVEKNGFAIDTSYFKESSCYYRIPAASLMQGIIADMEKGKPKGYIVAKFHYSMVGVIGVIAAQAQVQKICFSGGVFQNALLADWIRHEYHDKYQLYFHKDLSPNDENISFGQMVYYDNKITAPAMKEANHPEMEIIEK
jgi:hydrogenase maturation protein HypF